MSQPPPNAQGRGRHRQGPAVTRPCQLAIAACRRKSPTPKVRMRFVLKISAFLSAFRQRLKERLKRPPLGRDRFSLWRPRPARLSAYSWAVSAYRWPKHQNTMAMKSAISISSKWKCGPKNYFGQNRVAQRLFAGGGGGLGLPRRVSGLDARTPAGSVWVETGFSPGRSCASAASMHAGFLQKLRGRRGAPR